MNSRRALIVSALVLLFAVSRLFATGGAWQTGVPVTGNAAATDEKKTTNVTIEDEKLTIDLHQEFAVVEVRYRMKNTGGQVDQDFFFPGRERTVSVANNIGAMRLKARVEIDGHVRETPALEVRRFAGNGFRAAITEQFELPYLFGSGELNDGNNTGPETGFGADCANFAVYALRRQGRAVPWSNPKQLRKYLEPVAENVRAGETAIRENLGGDVMLGRTIGLEIERGADPFAAIRPRLERASSRIVNLECVLSEKGAAIAGKRYCFRAPLDAMRVLTAARINAVSLANNHARDFGQDGLLDAIAGLQANNISVVGASEKSLDSPLIFQTRAGAKAAVIALDDTKEERMPDRDRVAAAISEARRQASFVLVFMHWGEENTDKVSERQRELARWSIDHGADAIAGSHPHCVQPFDSYHGKPIFYSLGNLVFDGAPTLPNWNRGNLLEVNLDAPRPSFTLVPVQLDARGFPQLAEYGVMGGSCAPTRDDE